MGHDPFSTFISEIIDAKQMTGIDDEVRTQLESDLRTRLLDQIDRAVIAALPDDKITEFNTLLDEGADEAQIQQFVADSGVDIQRVSLETMLQFRSAYIGSGDR